MPAHEHLNKNQLRMFMRPQEIYDLTVDSIDRADEETLEDTWVNKESETFNFKSRFTSGLAKDVIKKGVQRPVTMILNHGHYKDYTMGQGHHRVKAAEYAEKATGKEYYVPVVYDWDYNETEDDKYIPEGYEDWG